MKTVAIVQARLGSTRLPNKSLRKINDEFTVIGLLLHRLSKSQLIDKIIVAMPDSDQNDPLAEYVTQLGYGTFRGHELDVLDRYFNCAKQENADVIVRITGDCPFIDAGLVDQLITYFHSEALDYASNAYPPTLPDGLDAEVMSFKTLEKAHEAAVSNFDREHVTPFIRSNENFLRANLAISEDYSKLRWTVDEREDLEVIRNAFSALNFNADASWLEIVHLQNMQENIFNGNSQIIRNEGAAMATGQKLYKRAKKCIVGGNLLLSKRPEMFLPTQWPSYFSKAKGISVWDLDGRKYDDFSIMGIGTNILGYGHPAVDEAVSKTVIAGVSSTFNCPEEVYLAERLIDMHSWASKAKFARTGGEANAIALRIGRAASGKDGVAVCGYHGWHDWYLAANLQKNDALKEHHLSGLSTKGVPKAMGSDTYTFRYNDIDALSNLVKNNEIGVVKMEVRRNYEPAEGYLQSVRDLCNQNGIVLIFDECTSGFRETFGGLHLKYGVNPDIAVFGKALGNGYAITAILGNEEVMENAEESFISSTFFTERVGPSAALATLKVMEDTKSWDHITELGLAVKSRWSEIAEANKLPITVSGLPSLASFVFDSPDHLKFKTYLTQEMLKQSYLGGPIFYTSIAHSEANWDKYYDILDCTFRVISNCFHGLASIDELLETPVCHAGFSRLN